MTVSVVLIGYHGDRWLDACLTSLVGAANGKLHLVLVDNTGNTVIEKLDLSNFDCEILRTPRPMGFAEANNFALVEASRLKEIVLFLNQDTISPRGWIDRCLDALDADASLGAVCPLIRNYENNGYDPSFLACLSETQKESLPAMDAPGGYGENISGHVWGTELAPAPALLVRTSVLRKVGPFDPIYGSYYEDYDLCRRIRRAGYRIGFVTSARLRHFSGSTTDTPEKERRRMRQILRNRLIYRIREDRRPRWLELADFFGLNMPRRLLRGMMRTPSSQPPAVVIQAAADVAKISRRIVFRKLDEKMWADYLKSIGWLVGEN